MPEKLQGGLLIRRFSIALVIGAAVGIGSALAQDTFPGQIDAVCANDCAARGYDSEFCGQVCWIPDPATVARGENLDWKCVTSCRAQGSKLSDCLPRCQRR